MSNFILQSTVYFANVVDRKKNISQVKEILDRYGIDIDPRARMNSLTIAKQQMVEIVRAIAFDAKIMVRWNVPVAASII